MNNVYDVILSNLMKIENEEDTIVRMIAYAKIGGIIEYAFVKGDIEEEIANKFMYAINKDIYSCVVKLNS